MNKFFITFGILFLAACGSDNSDSTVLPTPIPGGDYVVDLYIDKDTCNGQDGETYEGSIFEIRILEDGSYLLLRAVGDGTAYYYYGVATDTSVIFSSKVEAVSGWTIYEMTTSFNLIFEGEELHGTMRVDYTDSSGTTCYVDVVIIPPVREETIPVNNEG